MKRSWMGFGLLVALLVFSFFSAWRMTAIHEPIEAQLQQAAYWSSLEDWETAEKFYQRAETNWKKSEHFRSSKTRFTQASSLPSLLRFS